MFYYFFWDFLFDQRINGISLFDFKLFRDFHVVLFFLLTSSLILLGSENNIISILFNVLRFVFWLRIQSILVDA